MSVTVRFACGHTLGLESVGDVLPMCGCGETRVQHVQAPVPRFRGACSGPVADTKNVEAGVVTLATAGPLRLKGPDTDGV